MSPAATRTSRADVQAMRAIAVGLVIANHIAPGHLRGGYVGVDVFFVISGLLITTQLVREAERTGRVRLGAFWARRARRILPAALLVLTACIVAVVALVDVTRWNAFLTDIRAAALYVANVRMADTATDYFAAGGAPSPVQHYWSLSVEEQFYLVWPLLIGAVALAAAARRAWTVVVLAMVTAVSFAWALLETASDPRAAYFATSARAWEFGLGGLLALAPPCRWRPARRQIITLAGLLAIAVAARALGGASAIPAPAAAVPVVGAAVALWAATPGRWASWRPVQWIGDHSYGLYLWHWPLLVFAPYLLDHPPGPTERVLLVIVAVGAAAATKSLVEDPVRFGRALVARPAGLTLAATAVGTAVVVGAAGAAASREHAQLVAAHRITEHVLHSAPPCLGAAARDPKRSCDPRALASTVVPAPIEASRLSNGICHELPYRVGGKRVCALGADPATAAATVALIGDSHSIHWRSALHDVAKARHWRALQFGHPTCPLSRATRPLREPDATTCPRWRRAVVAWLRRHSEVSTVFLAQFAGGVGVSTRPGRSAFQTAVDGYADAWQALPSSVRHVIVIRDNPRTARSTASCVEQAMAHHVPAGPHCASARSAVLDPDPAAAAARRLGPPRVHLVDLTHFFCGPRQCLPVIGGVLVYQDGNHMTAAFNHTLGPYLLHAVDRILPRRRPRVAD